MADIQSVFDRIKGKKQKRKDLQALYKEALGNSKTYQELLEDMDRLKDKKLRVEAAIRAEFVNEFAQIDRLKGDLQSDEQLLNDMVLSEFMKGETIEIMDEYNNKYEPVFKVGFKKAN
jgi:hypothetical protein